MLSFVFAFFFIESIFSQVTNPPLPTQWHAKVQDIMQLYFSNIEVVITEGTLAITQQEQLDVTATGDFYYDANSSITGTFALPGFLVRSSLLLVYVLTNSLTGRITREICVPGGSNGRSCYVIDTSANTCQAAVSTILIILFKSSIFSFL